KSYPGRVHDYNIFKQENTAEKLSRQSSHYVDCGYDDAPNDYPECTIIMPVKRRKNHPALTRAERRFNRKHSRIRILVEHVLSRMKKYQILAQVYRHKIMYYNQRFRNSAALVNFRLATAAI
ncbi:MAG: transposase family protein, partial [Candidatus Brocadiaceae bacterium]|nr:transposase family protein [Candidatus Brocadiaceae bacterium]